MEEKWRITGLMVGFLILLLLGVLIISDIIFYILGKYPSTIIRFFITLIFMGILYKFTWFGKEIEENIKKWIEKILISIRKELKLK